jgi:hypothetical protein
MRIIKLAFISFILLFGVITAISLFIPSDIRISKAINMNTSLDSVWSKVDNPGKWSEWNTLSQKKAIRWIALNKDEHIAEIITANRSSLVSGWKCIQHSGIDSITVQWYLDFHLKWWPWEKFRSLLFEKTYGAQMEAGLSNLKTLLEK